MRLQSLIRRLIRIIACLILLKAPPVLFMYLSVIIALEKIKIPTPSELP